MNKAEIAQAFSIGEFEKIYNFISDDAEWTIVAEKVISGKKAIAAHCEQVGNYFKSVTTHFKIVNIITDGNKVVINGTAEFLKDDQQVSFISACDIYEFNDSDHIQLITSYCIQS